MEPSRASITVWSAIAVVFLALSFTSSAHAQLSLVSGGGSAISAATSFGGRIISIYPTCLNGGTWVMVAQPLPKQPSVINLIWTPSTLTFLYGPPRSIGQSLLGRFDVPYQCVISYKPYIYLPGMRMTMVGTSAI